MISDLLWWLIAVQIAMGAFDTLYHHELTERLAWRPSQRRELQLHAVRNALYAVLFLAIGWLEVHGAWAALVMAVLAVEVLITLWDFVEEDLSRRLPASERINHTLLAVNYGAIMVLLMPVLANWADLPTGVVPSSYGYWSVLASAAAVGVALFGLRDWAASRRTDRLGNGPADELMQALPGPQTVLVTGATGFIGRRLVEALSTGGHSAIVLLRDPAKSTLLRPPFRLVTSLDQLPDDTRIDAIVNLAGEPIANGLWTATKRREMLASRLAMTDKVVRLIGRLQKKPAVLVSGSAVGWYGLWQDEALSEASDGRPCFSRQLCQAWENAALKAEALGVRVACLRTGLVLGTDGGLLARLLTAFEFGLGGPIGTGRQWMSWIERDDLVRLIAHAIATPELVGPLNATAPEPVQNHAFTKALGAALDRPTPFRVPAGPLHAFGGDFADELLLGGQRVLPAKALASGFVFRHRTLPGALAAILGTGPRTVPSGRGAEMPPAFTPRGRRTKSHGDPDQRDRPRPAQASRQAS
jgi:uncharacterized protein (TIGR01777 family)